MFSGCCGGHFRSCISGSWREAGRAVFKLMLYGAVCGFKITQVRVSCFLTQSGMQEVEWDTAVNGKRLVSQTTLGAGVSKSPCRMLCPFPFLLLSACQVAHFLLFLIFVLFV